MAEKMFLFIRESFVHATEYLINLLILKMDWFYCHAVFHALLMYLVRLYK